MKDSRTRDQLIHDMVELTSKLNDTMKELRRRELANIRIPALTILTPDNAVKEVAECVSTCNSTKTTKNSSRKIRRAKHMVKEVKNEKTSEKKAALVGAANGARQAKLQPKNSTRKTSTSSKPVLATPQPDQVLSAAQRVQRRLPKSVRLTPHELTLNVGAFTIKELAVNDAKELIAHPAVFWNRSTQFPDPRRYGVQPHVEGARVIKRSDPKFSNAPYTVCLTITTDGPDKKTEAWNVGVYTRNKSEQEG